MIPLRRRGNDNRLPLKIFFASSVFHKPGPFKTSMSTISRLVSWFRGQSGNNGQCEEKRVVDSVSYVRPTFGAEPVNANCDKERSVWIQEQQGLGRYIVSDSHFRAGGHIRSIPRIHNGENCTLLTRRRNMLGREGAGDIRLQETNANRQLMETG